MRRASVSAMPPGAKATMSVILLDGNVCASARPQARTRANIVIAAMRKCGIEHPPVRYVNCIVADADFADANFVGVHHDTFTPSIPAIGRRRRYCAGAAAARTCGRGLPGAAGAACRRLRAR